MQAKQLSVEEIKAVAEAAMSTKAAADAAKVALDADPENETLKTAYQTALQAATDAKTKADTLSQRPQKSPEQLAKIRRKHAILTRQLEEAGVDADEDDEDDDIGDDDDDKPLTRGDLKRMETARAAESTAQMAEAITDPVARAAVKQALDRIRPSGDPEKDFRDAVAVANREKNSKVLEELGRRPIAPQHRSGAGSPPRPPEAEFQPTTDEAKYMKPPFNLSKEDILRSRAESGQQ